MNKRIWAMLIGIGAFIGLMSSIWGVSSYWHGYTSAEIIHEHEQTREIKLAMDKSQLAINQQRSAWLEERLFEYEKKHGCREGRMTASCSDRIWRTYQKYLKEYIILLEKIAEQTTGN